MESANARRLIALLILLPACIVAAPPAAGPYCKRLPFDEEVPPGLTGKYEILGKDAGSGKIYSGSLEIAVANGTYTLARTVQGRTLRGEAWAEVCSPDKFQVLRVMYQSKPKAINLHCYLRFDGDNFTRASCTNSDGRGLEAWYQTP